ncbi:hypothetical protein TCDM_10219 [Trypanosoma cruzi Dm28c]|uniref:Uncharacterized protein n=1 Tax=Trypanosoma cruzi Dm28c TaxID=1416333 RepID=V5B3I6_TRYCR|nr:hypothetical protein TCDM_10219 [Trypanosoma cruzi Dm28c]
MEQAESAAEAAHKAHTSPRQETARFEPNSSKKWKTEIKPYAVASLCFWKPAWKNLGPHPARAGDISAAWRRRTLIPWNRWCSELIFRPRLCSASAAGKSARPSFCAVSRVTLHYAAAAAALPGGWEMDRPLTPYEFDVAIRDPSLGSAPGHDNMLNEFPHHLGPVAHGTLRTMIHKSFANGSLPGSWKMGDAISIPKPGKSPCRPESCRPIKSLSVSINRRNDSPPSVSVIAAPPTSIRAHTFAFNIGRDDNCYWQNYRGLNEFSTVEYERPGGGAPHGTLVAITRS